MNKFAALGFALFCLPALSWAQLVQDTRAEGMSGALRADPVGNSALVTNPAGMSRAGIYGAEFQYVRAGLGDLNGVGANIVDSKTQPQLAVGIAYSYSWADGSADQDYSGHHARLGIAHALVPQRLNFGIGLQYVHVSREYDPDYDGFTLDLGLQATLDPHVHIGILGENLVHIKDSSLPRRAGGGLAVTGDYFTIEGDVAADFDSASSVKPVFMGGLELLVANVLPLRLGYENNRATKLQWLTGAVGFISTGEIASGSQINVSYRQNLDHTRDFALSVGLTFFM